MRRVLVVPLVVLLMPYAARADSPPFTAYDVCKAFRTNGLEATPCRRMRKADWGLAGRPRNAIEGRRFVVEALCDEYEDPCDSGGRVIRFNTMRSLRAQKRYYDQFGKKGDLLFSWTFVNRRRLTLVQINGELPEEQALKYKATLSSL